MQKKDINQSLLIFIYSTWSICLCYEDIFRDASNQSHAVDIYHFEVAIYFLKLAPV